MPTAVDLSTWNSIWTLERIAQTGYHPELRSTLREFNVGYIVLDCWLLFLGLGALVLYTDGTALPEGTAAFAGIVSLYTEPLVNGAVDHRSGRIFSYARHVHRLPRRVCTGLGVIFQHPNGETRLANARTVVVGRGFNRSACAYLGLSKRHPNASGCCDHFKLHRGASVAAANWYLVSQVRFPASARPPLWLHVLAGLGMLFLVGSTLLLLCLNLIAPRQSPAAPLQICRQN